MQEKLRDILLKDGINPPIALAVACGSVTVVVLWKWVIRREIQRKMKEAQRWRNGSLEQMEKVAWKLKQKNPGIQSEFILSLTLTELAEKLREEKLSSESVLYTYIKKALEVTQEVNCVTDFLHGCEEQVQDLKKQKEKGLLYGIPVSIKDHIGYKGHISTCGLVQYLDKVEADDSVIVKVLKKQGAIPFVKTNIPQSMINYDCSNLIFGQTRNPLNHKKSPGGSSGGEGALIAGGGSLLGFGTDVAGSIRLPSSFCGLCGLKPTGSRLSTLGLASPVAGMKSVTATIGPMARDVDSLALCMKALLCDELFHLDPSVPPMPFREEIYTSSNLLRIGYYKDDVYFQPSPSMKRAVQETKNLLQAAGHTLLINYSNVCRSAKNLWKQHAAVAAYREEFIAEWRKLKLDVILCPVLGPAFNEGYPGKLFAATSYTNLYNVLNFPAGVVPVTIVTQADEEELKQYQGHYADPWDKRLKEAVTDAVGLPVAVQCVALAWQEELCLRFMKEVETLTCKNRLKA
ncbi:vitamin D3 hydroxylase-associated protein-like [Notechis scutatus]|uniref:Fatty-acid amide hydrolase 1 n=1 Tax=Notechis scutatus TaxID=8663 RepID=A0A6J1U0V8_9SAUR|nr:vitamin D3 hydroxylase-associated protein-like [Notechis scutatus]